ncbi:Potassium channel subfamily K member 9, partial [Pseudolycoriella hygida]
LGRSKFLPKPKPQEINVLLAECDRNCHHEHTDTTRQSGNKTGGNLETLEDDDDDENRVGRHHGTPSRMPLIKPPHNALKPSEFNTNVSNNEQRDEIEHNSLTTHNSQVPITVILLILTTYICIGTVIFSLWENWSIVDGAYFCFVTLSTIGFGDLEPIKTFHGPELQLFACCSYLILAEFILEVVFSERSINRIINI